MLTLCNGRCLNRRFLARVRLRIDSRLASDLKDWLPLRTKLQLNIFRGLHRAWLVKVVLICGREMHPGGMLLVLSCVYSRTAFNYRPAFESIKFNDLCISLGGALLSE